MDTGVGHVMAIDWIPYELSDTYPHLHPHDQRIWRQFVLDNPLYFDEVAYGVLVGLGQPVPPDLSPEMVYDWLVLTQSKIDVVARRGAYNYIIEVKPSAGYSALGQVLAYRHLAISTLPELTDPILIILSDWWRRDPSLVIDYYAILRLTAIVPV